MYDYLNGDLVAKTPTQVVVEAGGVGYRAEVSLRTSEQLPPAGSAVRLLGNDLFDHIVRDVLNLGNIARLRVTKHDCLERFRFGAMAKWKVDRIRKRPGGINAGVLKCRR